MTRIALRAAGFLVLTACSTGRSEARTAEVSVTAEFRADGSCTVSVDGAQLYGVGDGARTIFLHARAVNIAPAGYELHELWCAPPSDGEPELPDTPGGRAFFVSLYAHPSAIPAAGSYTIARSIPEAGEAATHANVVVYDPAHVPASTQPSRYYLTGISGTVTLASTDSSHAVGRVNTRAVVERGR